jgi:hypothetical protein
MTRCTLLSVLGYLVLVLTSACSSSKADEQSDGSDNTEITLENVCDVAPRLYCQQMHPCCSQAGYVFDEAGCESSIRTGWCALGVAAVAGHRASFHPEKVRECVRLYQPYEDRCLLTGAELMELGGATGACNEVFEGPGAEGAACTDQFDCAPGDSGPSYCLFGTCGVLDLSTRVGAPCDSVACEGGGLICDDSQTCIVDPDPSPLESPQGCVGQ